MSGNIAVTGIPTTPDTNGAIPLRRELLELQHNFPDHYNLFILGLKNLQRQDENILTSYYQIAGIHGMPYKPWNGVGSNTNWRNTSGFGGYCTHSSILFLTWHRPYLALYEQSLYNAVQKVARRFPKGVLRDRYLEAAKTFRAPYFDWASQPPPGSPAFPSALTSPKVQVVDVDGKTKLVNNPLYRYSFHRVNPAPGDFSRRWSRYKTTVRYADRLTGKSQDSCVSPILANELASVRSNVSLLLLSYTNFDAFSFNGWDSYTKPSQFGSLEDVHNEIHDRIGGNGHMSSLEVSAFDPFFWLHHFNIDRLWAIWQDLNPDSFMTLHPAPYATFNAADGESQTSDTPLAPFWDKTGTRFWTSGEVRDTHTFGYAYPETQRWRFPDQKSYQTNIRRTVVKLYGSNVPADFLANIAQRRVEHARVAKVLDPRSTADMPAEALSLELKLIQQEDQEEAEAVPAPTPTISPSLHHPTPSNTYTEWLVNIRAQKHGLGGPFRILVFLNHNPLSPPSPPPNPPSTGNNNDFHNCVGRVSVLGRAATRCGRCRTHAARGLMVSGTMPLTAALLDAAEVVPYLRERLAWRVTLFDGGERSADEVPGLKVSVASTRVVVGEDGLPNYSGEYRVWPEITEGKLGGLGVGEHI
ncbi:common central domain of tyrosinase-domain-containing protein [Chaetomium tenue]|uniref:Common central domain of tyrosinase-domain-containing protein n=1 Tax=Chaetomium tenue TaxID=1854479 RepID=A0ACB7PSA7_9PEZI|nr:common central domain of tyrosinase-domain-containing protein [Chaetomium globosum]